MDDVTIHIFPVAFLGPESEKQAKAVMCAKNPADAWFETLLEGKVPKNNGECKDEYIEENVELARKLNVRGTPAIIFADGSRIGGFAPMEVIEERLKNIK